MKRRDPQQAATARNARKILRFLSRRRGTLSPLLILTHDYPDPDTLASAYALQYLAARRFGIESKIVYGGIIGRMENREMVRLLKLPVRKLQASDLRKFEHVALVDTQPGFQNNSFPKNRRATLVIDQHPSVEKPAADLAVIDPDCGATCIILAKALLRSKTELPSGVATALAYGILSDTLNLYRARRPDIMETYLAILPRCDLRVLAQIQNPARSRRFFTTLARGIETARVSRRLIVSHLGVVENPDLVSQIADFLLTYSRMHWSLATGRFGHKLHVSLRIDNPNADAGEILRDIFEHRGEAGGHDAIAGGSFKVGPASQARWQEAEESLLDRLRRRVRVPVKPEFYTPFRGGAEDEPKR